MVTQGSNSQLDRLPFRCRRQGLQSFTRCRTLFIPAAAWGHFSRPNQPFCGTRACHGYTTLPRWSCSPIQRYGLPSPVVFDDRFESMQDCSRRCAGRSLGTLWKCFCHRDERCTENLPSGNAVGPRPPHTNSQVSLFFLLRVQVAQVCRKETRNGKIGVDSRVDCSLGIVVLPCREGMVPDREGMVWPSRA